MTTKLEEAIKHPYTIIQQVYDTYTKPSASSVSNHYSLSSHSTSTTTVFPSSSFSARPIESSHHNWTKQVSQHFQQLIHSEDDINQVSF